ncbi:MAG TPA: carboxyl transferase domain-containing protein [Dehalococcoidia bacterium]|nr:carboxyl transferase domain-containing protein [Dehalococcoidia bacterium]
MEERLVDGIREARAAAMDAARPDAVAAIHASGQLTARERLDALFDPGSFVEYGVLAEAAADDPGEGPADGLVAGAGRIAGQPVVAASYDQTVLDGTQSERNQRKLTRVLYLANAHRWPFVCFVDGAGARPNQSREGPAIAVGARSRWDIFDGLAELSGWAPSVAILSGTAMDGNVSIAMLCDFVVATQGSTIGSHESPHSQDDPEAATRRSVSEYESRGDLDLLVADEPEAIEAARTYLSYYLTESESGPAADDATSIAEIIPDGRRRPYEMRKVIRSFADADSVFELRPNWARSMITALARLDGRTVGIFANQPKSPLAGAIDADAADKASRFIELCDAYEYPIVSFIDNPGYMVGPQAERAGIARHHARPLAALQHRSVPLYSVQIRKAYGLGPSAMSGFGSSRSAPDLRLAWPSVESGGMSLEGAAYLVKRKEILAAKTPQEGLEIRDAYATKMRDLASGIRAGRTYSFDDVLLPHETRDRIAAMVKMTPRRLPEAKKHPIDPV